MRQIKLKIGKMFNGLSLKELIDYYHLGKEKQKKLEVIRNGIKLSSNDLLRLNDELIISYSEHLSTLPYEAPLDILYEDDNLLIVNKPINLLVHPDNPENTKTLANIVANYYLKTNQDIEVRYVHRIDYDTSGIVIFAKDLLTSSRLNYEISIHKLVRQYLCICSGVFKEDSGTFNYPIAEDRHQANKKRVSKTGKEAITNYQVLERYKHKYNLCLVQLQTGRTHQIRLHFSYSGHPLVGDFLYNGNCNELKRQALHSYRTIFIQPITQKKIDITCQLPKDMNEFLYQCKKSKI